MAAGMPHLLWHSLVANKLEEGCIAAGAEGCRRCQLHLQQHSCVHSDTDTCKSGAGKVMRVGCAVAVRVGGSGHRDALPQLLLQQHFQEYVPEVSIYALMCQW